MSSEIVDPSDLATYLSDPKINQARASALIADAQILCESVVSPLPAGASVVVKRVAARAYVSVTSGRQTELAGMSMPMGSAPGGLGGVWLSRTDKADLRRLAGGGGAFSIDLLPQDFTVPTQLSVWDDPVASETDVGGGWV